MKKILIIFLILLLIPCNIKADKVATRGELRCPVSEKGKSCVETVKNNEVIKTEVTIENNDVKVVKVVEKTNKIGEYKVYFKIYNKGKMETIKPEVDIVLVLDASSSVTYYYNNGVTLKGKKCRYCKPVIPNAAKSFANKFNGVTNVRLGLIKFNKSASVLRGLKSENFNSVDFGRVKTGSYIYDGLKQANNMLNDNSRRGYIVILGDGIYGKSDNYKGALSITNNLRNRGINVYTIGYEIKNQTQKNKLINLAGGANHYYNNSNLNKVENEFLNVANAISGDIQEQEKNSSAKLIDNLGDYFTVEGGKEVKKSLDIKNITSSGVKTESFIVSIAQNAETGWHKTNNGFTLKYKVDDTEKELNGTVNPEVYWIQNNIVCNTGIVSKVEKKLKTCSNKDETDLEIKSNCNNDTEAYYDITCKEKVATSIKINNLNDGVDKFNIGKGLGFPAKINLKTELVCEYMFNANLFNQAYNDVNRLIQNSANDKIKSSNIKVRDQVLKGMIDDYIEQSKKENLENYASIFNEQTATLKVDKDNVDFVNASSVITNLNCTNKTQIKLANGQTVTSKKCTLSLAKDMVLPEKCLNMKDGSVENCSDSNNQISGGNKYYTSLIKDSGSIKVEINSLGYKPVLDIVLDECDYTTSKSYKDKISFRQIELSDPFLKTYTNSKREIGKNYSNTKYDFVSIIKPELWDTNEFKYKINLSKLNVSNIRHDTNNLGISSYLGSDCYINNLNKYVCKFFEESEKNNFFTNTSK